MLRCKECHEELSSLDYKVDCTEYGSCELDGSCSQINDTDNYDTWFYSCPECGFSSSDAEEITEDVEDEEEEEEKTVGLQLLEESSRTVQGSDELVDCDRRISTEICFCHFAAAFLRGADRCPACKVDFLIAK